MVEHAMEERDKEDQFWRDCCGWCGEWMRHDRLDTLGWGAIFLWAAFVLLAQSTGYASNFAWWKDGWGVFLAGAGAIVLVETTFRILMPEYRKGIGFGLFFGSILLGIGLGGWNLILPLLLAVAGISIFLKAMRTDRGGLS
ncbi:MAG: hypothetical protein JSV26_01590 [bacterium]|nr:MAG: hypothetical protein JSV26_01590 [bacterium]